MSSTTRWNDAGVLRGAPPVHPTDRDRGAPHDAAPPTPPGIRVTYLGGSIGLSFSMCSRAFGFYHRQDRFGRSAAVRSRGASPTCRSQSFGPSSVVSGAAYPLLRLSAWSASLALPTARPTMPSAHSCATVGSPHDFPSSNNGTMTQSSPGKFDRLHRTPAGSTA